MMNAFLIFIGGGLGSLARWGVSVAAARRYGEAFPWGTLFVNVMGSFLIAFFATATGHAGRWTAREPARFFFMAGVCGGYTTFSTFSLQTLGLAETGQWFRAGLNVFGTVFLCLVAVWLGHILAVMLNSSRSA